MELDMIRFSISAVTAAGLLLKKSNSKESVKNRKTFNGHSTGS